MEFRLLGPLEVLRDGRPVAVGGSKPRALLALLLLSANEVVSRDRLIDALWAARPPGTAEHSLDVQISRLRRALRPDEILVTRSGGYVLEVVPDEIDAHRFEQLLEDGRRANAEDQPAEALAALEAALFLWRGDALADLLYEEFARAEADRLEELRLVAIEERIDAELALGRHDALVHELHALVGKHPLRERLRGQLMLALYRSGRQAEALRVYGNARTHLVAELGIEPGPALKELEQAILRQDPGLAPRRPMAVTRRRRTFIGAGTLAVAGAAVALAVGLAQGGTEQAQAVAEADSNVFLVAETGEAVRDTPARNTTHVRFGYGSLWSASADGELNRIDPGTGEVVARIGLEIEPSGLAVGESAVWVTGRNSTVLYRIDPSINDIVDRFPLPQEGVVTDQAGEVAVGAGSVWVGHGAFKPGAWVERVDPETERVEHRIPILGGDADHLAFGDGVLWVASQASGELRRIDPGTNTVVFTRQLRKSPCCVAAGGGFAWVGISPDAQVWKVSGGGDVLETIEFPDLIENVTYAAGAVWVAVGDEGTVVRIDPTTSEQRTYNIGHHVADVDVQRELMAVGVRQAVEDITPGLSGDVVRVARADGSLFRIGGRSTDPVLYTNFDDAMIQFQYATCARLYNYRDVEGTAGTQPVPEIAAGPPEVSGDGRTYTIRIRDGFRFSPPSGQPVTAESFRYALERKLSPKFDRLYFPPEFANLVGAEDYHAGKTRLISGLSTRGDSLVIRLVKPAPDLTRALASSVFCPVPEGTPIVPHGVKTPIPSAGPYYLSAHTDAAAVLRRNPYYGGTRPQKLDAIVYELGVAAGEAASRIADGTLDYILQGGPDFAPGSAAARTAGSRYRLTPGPIPAIHFFAFNYERPLFADIRWRRAVQFALNRRVLARLDPDGASLVATRLIPPNMPGYESTPLYPPSGDLRAARRLVGGRKATVVVYTFDDPVHDAAFNDMLRRQLAAIGLRMKIVRAVNADFEPGGKGLAKVLRSDMIWSGEGLETGDLARYLERFFLFPREEAKVKRILKLSPPERDERAVALAQRVDRQSLFAVYDSRSIPELVSDRVGCIVHQPMYPGVDLAALCLRKD